MSRYLTLEVLEYLGELDTYYPQIRKDKNKKEPLQKVVRVKKEGGLAVMMFAPQSLIASLRPQYCVIIYSAEDNIPVGKVSVYLGTNKQYTNLYYSPDLKEKTIDDDISALKQQIVVLTNKIEEMSKKL